MLKVVGASGYQTIISLGILVGVFIFGMLIIFIVKTQSSVDDGKYSATVTWNSDTERYVIELWGQNNDPETVKQGIARAYYQPDMQETGWAALEIESNPKYSDEEQAFAAGILEGSLSWQHIFWQWENTVKQACEDRKEFCSALLTFLERNTEIIRKKAKANDRTDPFWHQVNLFYIQLEGIEFGWRYEVEKNKLSLNIPSLDFLWMNIVPDLKDFEKISTPSENSHKHSPAAMSLIKILPKEDVEFLLAHASSGFYSSMLRIQKKYTFNYRFTGDMFSEPVPGRIVSFTSYPASIHSQDDFYQITLKDDSKITVTGTALLTVNFQDVNHDQFQQKVLVGPRIMAGNRLSRDGKTWCNIVKKFSSGTGNKQWSHIHVKNKNLTFWVLEQTPQRVVSKEVTKMLLKNKYWISYGMPHFQRNENIKVIHDEITEHRTGNISLKNIVQVLEDGQKNVSDIQSLLSLMRGPDLALAGRSDLLATSDEAVVVPPPSHGERTPIKKVHSDKPKSRASFRAQQNLEKTPLTSISTSEIGTSKILATPNQAQTAVDDNLRIVKVDYANSKNFTLKYNTSWRRIFDLKNNIMLVPVTYSPRESRPKHYATTSRRPKRNSFALGTKSIRQVGLKLGNTVGHLPVPKGNAAGYSDGLLAGTDGAAPFRRMGIVDGVIDLKLTSNNDRFLAAAGPPFNIENKQRTVEPFQWSKSPINYLPHKGHSDIWNYKPVVANFVWD